MQLKEMQIKNLEKIKKHFYREGYGSVYIVTTDTEITKVGATCNIYGRIYVLSSWLKRKKLGEIVKFSFSNKLMDYMLLEKQIHYALENYRYKNYKEVYTLPYEEIKNIFYKTYKKTIPLFEKEKTIRYLRNENIKLMRDNERLKNETKRPLKI